MQFTLHTVNSVILNIFSEQTISKDRKGGVMSLVRLVYLAMSPGPSRNPCGINRLMCSFAEIYAMTAHMQWMLKFANEQLAALVFSELLQVARRIIRIFRITAPRLANFVYKGLRS